MISAYFAPLLRRPVIREPDGDAGAQRVADPELPGGRRPSPSAIDAFRAKKKKAEEDKKKQEEEKKKQEEEKKKQEENVAKWCSRPSKEWEE